MTKTQIQLTEASAPEGDAELPPDGITEWMPPTSSEVAWKGLSAAQLRDAGFVDADPRRA